MEVEFLTHLQGGFDSPFFIAIYLAISTFILEDVSTISAAILVLEGKISWQLALLAVYVGIIAGDVGLFLLGKLALHNQWARSFLDKNGVKDAKNWLEKNMVSSVIAARFLPGMRLPTYSACGFFGLSFWKFFIATGGAGSLWTGGLFYLTLKFGEKFWDELGWWRWVIAFVAVIMIIILPRILKAAFSRSKQFVHDHKGDLDKIMHFHHKDKQ